jgi:hypothetical protein
MVRPLFRLELDAFRFARGRRGDFMLRTLFRLELNAIALVMQCSWAAGWLHGETFTWTAAG